MCIRDRGETLLTALEEEEDSADTDGTDDGSDDATATDEEETDVLLTEAGNILVDMLLIKQQLFAVNAKPEPATH